MTSRKRRRCDLATYHGAGFLCLAATLCHLVHSVPLAQIERTTEEESQKKTAKTAPAVGKPAVE